MFVNKAVQPQSRLEYNYKTNQKIEECIVNLQVSINPSFSFFRKREKKKKKKELSNDLQQAKSDLFVSN